MKSRKDNHDLYFIAIVPNEPLQTKLMGFKKMIYEETGSKGALRSPAHITLHMPFKWQKNKEDMLLKGLQKLSTSITAFEILLYNFGCFKPRVVYVDVKKNESLISLKNEVMALSRKILKLDLPKDLRGFHPHITIGFRDLKKPQFYKIWEQLENKPFQFLFEATSISLLKHNGTKWKEMHSFLLNKRF